MTTFEPRSKEPRALEAPEESHVQCRTTDLCGLLAAVMALAVLIVCDAGLAYLALSASTPVGKAFKVEVNTWGSAAVMLGCFFLVSGFVRHGLTRDCGRWFGVRRNWALDRFIDEKPESLHPPGVVGL